MGLIRILLAISVVIAHTTPIFGFTIVGGQTAVETFYIISGFYMSLILNEKYIGQNNSYKLYLSNRLLRLYPIYWTIIILILIRVLVLFFLDKHITGNLGQFVKYYDHMDIFGFTYLVFTNIFLVGQDVIMFLGLNTHTGHLFFTKDFTSTYPRLYSLLFVSQAWTLGAEILFYIFAPFIVRKNYKIILIFLFLSVLVKVFLFKNGLTKDPWTYRFFPAELMFFLLGSCSYKIYRKIRKIEFKKPILYTISLGIMIFILFYPKIPIPYKTYVYFISIAGSLPFSFILTKNIKWDTKVGELSYPIYISHLFVLSIIGNNVINNYLGTGLVVTILTILLSVILNKLVSEPVEKIRQRRIKKGIIMPQLIESKPLQAIRKI